MSSKSGKNHRPKTGASSQTAHVQATFRQAMAFHHRGQLAEAKELYESVLKAMPRHFDALHLLGVLAFQTNNHGPAVELIGKAIEIYPVNAAFYSNLGNALQALGRFDEAVERYNRAIAIQPDYADAYNNRGIALQELKRFDEALESFSRAIAIQPGYADAHFNCGNILKELGRLEDAVPSYDRAIALQPNYAEAWINRGNTLKEMGHLEDAVENYGRATALQPDYTEAHYNRGCILQELKRSEEALESFSRAIALRPDYAEAHYNCGLALMTRKRHTDALASYDRAIAIRPDYTEAWNNRGNVLKELQRYADALECFNRAIALQPGYADAWYNRGNVLKELKLLEEAVESFARAASLRPGYTEAYNNCGNVLKELGRLEDALLSYDQAVDSQPDDAEAYNNRGNVLKEIGLFDAAQESYNRAIAFRPDYAEAYSNRGLLFQALGRLDDAIEDYNRAIACPSDYLDACWNKSLALLLAGNFAEGWPLYEWRWKLGSAASFTRDFRVPLWRGDEPLAGKTILLHSEQGWGDVIQFCRYARLVAELGARVILEVGQPLAFLLKNLEGVSEIIVRGSALPPFDCHCPLMSLPLAFHTTLDTIPKAPRYLETDKGTLKQWAIRLGEKGKPRIGLAWAGRTTHANDRNRSVTLDALLSHLPGGFQYVSLQKEVCGSDQDTLQTGSEILHFGGEIVDFSDTAALCEHMDLVISVDTSVAHLAGALGKNVWVLLPFAPDFRWLLDRDDSPWYPSARLYRQDRPGNWTGVFQRVERELQNLLPPGVGSVA